MAISNILQSYLIPQDSGWVKSAMAEASFNSLQEGVCPYLKAVAYPASAVAISLFIAAPLYLLRAPFHFGATLLYDLAPLQAFCDLGSDLSAVALSLFFGTFGVFYVFGGIFFPEKVFTLLIQIEVALPKPLTLEEVEGCKLEASALERSLKEVQESLIKMQTEIDLLQKEDSQPPESSDFDVAIKAKEAELQRLEEENTKAAEAMRHFNDELKELRTQLENRKADYHLPPPSLIALELKINEIERAIALREPLTHFECTIGENTFSMDCDLKNEKARKTLLKFLQRTMIQLEKHLPKEEPSDLCNSLLNNSWSEVPKENPISEQKSAQVLVKIKGFLQPDFYINREASGPETQKLIAILFNGLDNAETLREFFSIFLQTQEKNAALDEIKRAVDTALSPSEQLGWYLTTKYPSFIDPALLDTAFEQVADLGLPFTNRVKQVLEQPKLAQRLRMLDIQWQAKPLSPELQKQVIELLVLASFVPISYLPGRYFSGTQYSVIDLITPDFIIKFIDKSAKGEISIPLDTAKTLPQKILLFSLLNIEEEEAQQTLLQDPLFQKWLTHPQLDQLLLKMSVPLPQLSSFSCVATSFNMRLLSKVPHLPGLLFLSQRTMETIKKRIEDAKDLNDPAFPGLSPITKGEYAAQQMEGAEKSLRWIRSQLENNSLSPSTISELLFAWNETMQKLLTINDPSRPIYFPELLMKGYFKWSYALNMAMHPASYAEMIKRSTFSYHALMGLELPIDLNDYSKRLEDTTITNDILLKLWEKCFAKGSNTLGRRSSLFSSVSHAQMVKAIFFNNERQFVVYDPVDATKVTLRNFAQMKEWLEEPNCEPIVGLSGGYDFYHTTKISNREDSSQPFESKLIDFENEDIDAEDIHTKVQQPFDVNGNEEIDRLFANPSPQNTDEKGKERKIDLVYEIDKMFTEVDQTTSKPNSDLDKDWEEIAST